jgi:hypothetical protein
MNDFLHGDGTRLSVDIGMRSCPVYAISSRLAKLGRSLIGSILEAARRPRSRGRRRAGRMPGLVTGDLALFHIARETP